MPRDDFINKALTRDENTIREMFSHAARNYDLLNHLLSFNLDRGWRRAMVRRARLNPDENILLLDLCTGTGDVIFVFVRNPKFRGKAVGIDFAEPMLSIAREKAEKMHVEDKVSFMQANALDLPFEKESFHMVTISFGLRNLSDLDKGIGEIHRVLKPGGLFLSLEFLHPDNGLSKTLSAWYINWIVPFVGNIVNKRRGAYAYLSASRDKFINAELFDMKLKKAGFINVVHKHFLFRIATLHSCEKSK